MGSASRSRPDGNSDERLDAGLVGQAQQGLPVKDDFEEGFAVCSHESPTYEVPGCIARYMIIDTEYLAPNNATSLVGLACSSDPSGLPLSDQSLALLSCTLLSDLKMTPHALYDPTCRVQRSRVKEGTDDSNSGMRVNRSAERRRT